MRGHGRSQSWACREVSLDEALAVRGWEEEEEEEEEEEKETGRREEINISAQVPYM